MSLQRAGVASHRDERARSIAAEPASTATRPLRARSRRRSACDALRELNRGRSGSDFLWEWTKIFLVSVRPVRRHPNVPRRSVQDSERQHGEHAPGRRFPARQQAGLRRRGAVHAQTAAAASRAAARRRDRVRVSRGSDQEFREAAGGCAGRHGRDARRHADPQRRRRAASGTSSTPSRTWTRRRKTSGGSAITSCSRPRPRPRDTIRRETTGVRWSSQKGTTSCSGDNRDNSLDSRYWGFVADSLVKGRPFVIYYSYCAGLGQTHFAWLTHIRWTRLGERIRITRRIALRSRYGPHGRYRQQEVVVRRRLARSVSPRHQRVSADLAR